MRILSVDFNTVFNHCIKLYLDRVDVMGNPTLIWDELEYTTEIKKYLSVDARMLSTLVELFKDNKDADFVPIIDETAIVKNIMELPDEEKIDITHIDFLHDLVFDENDIKMWENDEYNQVTWLGYLLYKDKIEKCKWFRFGNSPECNNNIIDDVEVENIKTLSKEDNGYDVIYFSFSPCFVAYEFKYIYDLICQFFVKDITTEE